ncbi:MAG: archease [Sulfolobaceae archaeon]
MKRFEFFEHTADIGIKAYGRTLDELFENCALAVFEIITDTSKVLPKVKVEIQEFGYDLENLLYKWIEDLLYYYDSRLLVFSKFKVKVDSETLFLEAEAYGERFDPQRFEKRVVVKAMTYHEMEIKKTEEGYEAKFVVDI